MFVELTAIGGEELEDQVFDGAVGQLDDLIDQGGRLACEHLSFYRNDIAKPEIVLCGRGEIAHRACGASRIF